MWTSALLTAGGLLVSLFADGPPVFVPAIAIAGMGQGAFVAVDLAMLTEVLPATSEPGAGLAVIALSYQFPQLLVPVVGTVLLAIGDAGPNCFALFLSSVVAAVPGALAVKFVSRPALSIHCGRCGEAVRYGGDMGDDRAEIRYDKRGRVAHVVLDRPHVLNAMNRRMHAELAEVWDDFEADDDLWVAVVSGAGEQAFSVGQDLKELAALESAGEVGPSSFGSEGKPGWPRLTERFDLAKPVVAKVRGYAYGGGFELALACDVVVASDDAVFALPEAKLGLIAGAGGVFRLARQAPFRVALGHLLTGRPMSARRAWELGLVNDVVPAEDLDACVDGWVEDLLRAAPLAVRAVKQAATRSVTMPLEEAFAADYPWERVRSRSRDAREGPAAFAEKREPRWEGR
ncbi:enoyl-CoA-hydratase DpgD [Umezawaea sp.]|uniref:enoyl-CoA-hydratase DpgD n=1 Tax=Umezawaea sp. TaxID=1955258 RepID=UPI002ED10751